jgi:ubiquinone biosynthesis UbiH/UbiF/VisC/COQ6 family hydroxylase
VNRDCEIAVVGAGIVGLATALALHRGGFEVCLIERGQRPSPRDSAQYDPRVYALAPSSTRFLQDLDVWAPVRAQRAAPYQEMKVWDSDPQRGLSFSADGLDIPALGWIVEHGLLLDALWSAVDGVECWPDAAITAIDFDAPRPQLRVADGRELSADLVISAEGGDARLREWAGLETVGWRYPQTAIVCHLRSEHPHEDRALQRFLPGGPLAFLPLADGRRSIVWSLPNEAAAALLCLDDETFLARILGACQGVPGALYEPTPRLSFPLRLLHAPRYVRDRFALVGDSAHVIHPLAGQGLNLGLADAECLAADLRAARNAGRDWSGMRALGHYQRSRQAANVEMLALTDGLSRVFGYDLSAWRRLLSLGLSTANTLGPLKRQLAHRAMGIRP